MISLLSRIFPPQHGASLWLYLAASAVACALLFVILQALPPRSRRTLIKLITFVCGLFYVVEFFWRAGPDNTNPLSFAVPTMGNIFMVLTGFTVGLGVVNLLKLHGSNIVKQRSGWENSAILIAGMVSMAVAGIFYENSMFYRSMFRDMLNSFDAAMFAILAFFITSAAYRAFRIRSAESTLLMVTALLVMLGQIPIGQWLTSGLPRSGSYLSLLRLDNISNFLLRSVSSPAQRAIAFGLGLGALAIGLRIWLSLERGAYFEARVDES